MHITANFQIEKECKEFYGYIKNSASKRCFLNGDETICKQDIKWFEKKYQQTLSSDRISRIAWCIRDNARASLIYV